MDLLDQARRQCVGHGKRRHKLLHEVELADRIVFKRHIFPRRREGKVQRAVFEAVAADELTGWIAEGKLKPVQDVIGGFENMSRALANLCYGKNVGVQCCSVRGEPADWN